MYIINFYAHADVAYQGGGGGGYHHGGGGGGYQHGGGGGGYHHGGGGFHGGCRRWCGPRCCSYADEAVDAEENSKLRKPCLKIENLFEILDLI